VIDGKLEENQCGNLKEELVCGHLSLYEDQHQKAKKTNSNLDVTYKRAT